MTSKTPGSLVKEVTGSEAAMASLAKALLPGLLKGIAAYSPLKGREWAASKETEQTAGGQQLRGVVEGAEPMPVCSGEVVTD